MVRLMGPCLWAGLVLGLFASLSGCTPLPTPPARVLIIADGERRVVETRATSVRDLLTETAITLEGLDRVTPPETAQIRTGMTITITRVIEALESITMTLPFGRQTVRDATLRENETRLLQAGQPGIREQVYRSVWEDGVLKQRTLVKDAIIRPPQDEIIQVGQRPEYAVTQVLTGTLVFIENQDAWLFRHTSATRRQLTAFGDLDGRVFTLSPDGTRLLFTRAITEATHFNALWVLPISQVETTPFALDIYDVLWADWAPDNQNFAWTTAEVTERPPGWRGQNDLWTAILTARNILAGKQQVLKPEAGGGFGWWGTRYQWSPTGTHLAYSRPDEVGVVNLRTKERRVLAEFPPYRTYSSWAWNPSLSWTPEGSFIAAVLHGPSPGPGDPEDSPVFDLWLLEATGAYSMQVASEVGMWAMPVFSPDGETLLFGRALIPYQSHVSAYSLCAMDRDGSNQSCFFPPEGEPGIQVPGWWWSPDQLTFAFIYRSHLHLLQRGDRFSVPITSEGAVTAIDWR